MSFDGNLAKVLAVSGFLAAMGCGGIDPATERAGSATSLDDQSDGATETPSDNTRLFATPSIKPFQALYVVQNGVIYRVHPDTGDFEDFDTNDWSAVTAMTTINGYLYLINDGQLTKISTLTGVTTLIGSPDFPGATDLVFRGNNLYILEGAGIWKVTDLTTGSYQRLGTKDWTGATSMANVGDYLYVVHSSKLYSVNASTGAATQRGGADWGGPTRMAGYGYMPPRLVIAQDDFLWQITNFSSGAYAQVGDESLPDLTSLTMYASNAYAIQSSFVTIANASNGDLAFIGGPDWPGPTSTVFVDCESGCQTFGNQAGVFNCLLNAQTYCNY